MAWVRAKVDSRILQKWSDKGGETAVDFSASRFLLQQRSGYLPLSPHFPAQRQGNELLSGMQYITS